MTRPRDVALPANISERFWAKVERGAPDECWIWRGAVQSPPKSPYGYLSLHRRSKGGAFKRCLAHRVSYRIHFGELGGRIVRHTCHNPRCVNPGHLVAGEHSDNMRDMVAAGRSPAGAKNPRARLTDDDVFRILVLRDAGWTLDRLAARFQVHLATIDLICRGKTWRKSRGRQAAERLINDFRRLLARTARPNTTGVAR